MNFIIENTQVYGLDRAIKASGNPMRTRFNRDIVSDKDILRGILVQMDVTAPLFWWKQAQRYHWFDFISSQSTMHCLLKFNVKTQCVDETDPRVLEVLDSLIKEYNEMPEVSEEKKKLWRVIVASLPCGFCLGATMTTNYQQLKTMYNQRKTHKLVEWQEFCRWCETLPGFIQYAATPSK